MASISVGGGLVAPGSLEGPISCARANCESDLRQSRQRSQSEALPIEKGKLLAAWEGPLNSNRLALSVIQRSFFANDLISTYQSCSIHSFTTVMYVGQGALLIMLAWF